MFGKENLPFCLTLKAVYGIFIMQNSKTVQQKGEFFCDRNKTLLLCYLNYIEKNIKTVFPNNINSNDNNNDNNNNNNKYLTLAMNN